jgi:hypothetical protein
MHFPFSFKAVPVLAMSLIAPVVWIYPFQVQAIPNFKRDRVAQTELPSAPFDILPPQETIQAQDVRPLPGQLDEIPVFNSNSPEMVLSEGVLLSTFPPEGRLFPLAHLNYPFQGRFDIFAHHLARASQRPIRTMYIGILVNNPNPYDVAIDVLQGSSYLTQPDALFIDLPSLVEDPGGRTFAGPGSRVVGDVLRGWRQASMPTRLVVPAGRNTMLMSMPIPLGSSVPTSNGRSTLMRLSSSGPIYVASLAMYAPRTRWGERAPQLNEWETMLKTGRLAGPRDLSPTPLDRKSFARTIYGRVAGVAKGSLWQATLTDSPNSTDLTIPLKGRAFSYGLSLLPGGTVGTNQVQSAAMLVRYPDTAFLAHGNYGVEYNLKLPLVNSTRKPATVTVSLQTPLKEEAQDRFIRFLDPPEERIFFRGPVKVSYQDDFGVPTVRFFHVVQRRGELGQPLVRLALKPGERREVTVNLLYPPDATPPQLLTVQTKDDGLAGQ